VFWIFLTMAATGPFFIIDPIHRAAGWAATIIGSTGVLWTIFKHRSQNGPSFSVSRYGTNLEGRRQGVYITGKDGPIFDVRLLSIPVGANWVLSFPETLSRVDTEEFAPMQLSRCRGTNTDLDYVWRMLRESAELPSVFPLVLIFKDASGRWYRSDGELCRDVLKPLSGFDVRFLHQKPISKRSARKLLAKEVKP